MRLVLHTSPSVQSDYIDVARFTIDTFMNDQEMEALIIGAGSPSSPEPAGVPASGADLLIHLVAAQDLSSYSLADSSRQELPGEGRTPQALFVVGQRLDPELTALSNAVEEDRRGFYAASALRPEDLRYEIYRALAANLPRLVLEASAESRSAAIRSNELWHTTLDLSCDVVAPSVAGGDLKDVDLRDTLTSRLSSGTQVLFLLGEVGSGKTWFLKRLYADLVADYRRRARADLPELADLGRALRPPGRESMTDDHPLVGLGSVGIPTLESYQELRESSAKLLLLDAYDEAVANNPPGSRLRLLQLVLHLLTPSRQLVITSRTHLFETPERLANLVRAAGPPKLGSGRGNIDYQIVYIRPLTRHQVRHFIDVEYGPRAQQMWIKLAEIRDLPDLATRPVLLPMVCESLDDLEETRHSTSTVTGGELYRIYCERWLSRESWRLRLSQTGARRFFQDLALYLLNSAIDRINFDDIPALFPGYFPGSVLTQEQEAIADGLRVATFFSVDSEGRYAFAHRSFYEYFLAEKIVESLRRRNRALALHRFPSKVTDGFAVDLIGRDSNIHNSLLMLLNAAESPVARYLCAYLLGRLLRRGLMTDRPQAEQRLKSSLESEEVPFVMREILVTLSDLRVPIGPATLWKHVANPISDETIRGELQDYYGSLEEAREYLVGKLQVMDPDPLRLFYLISLSAIARPSEEYVFKRYAVEGSQIERAIVQQALSRLNASFDAS